MIQTVQISTPSKPNVFFGGDYHFDHAYQVRKGRRAFKSVEEMNSQLVEDHNAVVRPWDRVIFLGDMGWEGGDRTASIMQHMVGQKELIKGNHDHHQDIKYLHGTVVAGWEKYRELQIDGDTICLFHFPIMSWHKISKGSYHLHGHCHGEMIYPGHIGLMRIFDVGVDNIFNLTGSYAPLSWTQIKAYLSNRSDGTNFNHHTGTFDPYTHT